MRFLQNEVQSSNRVASKEFTPRKNPARSWSVFVFDSRRAAFPHHWLVGVFRQELDARKAWEQLRAKYTLERHLYFYLGPTDGEPHEVAQNFEKKFGTCPESLRLDLPQAKSGSAS